MTITERDLARKLTETFGVREWKPVIDIIKEVTGRDFAPEPHPLPTAPGSVIIATEVRGQEGEWRLLLDEEGDWHSPLFINGHIHHAPRHITAWTPARVVPVTAAPATLTEDQVEEFHEAARLKDPAGAGVMPFNRLSEAVRAIHTATVNAALARYATPAEDMPDWDDVRNAVASERGNGWSLNDDAINGITDAVMRLLHREEA